MSKRGLDLLLTTNGKTLQTGQEIRFTLVKGPSHDLAPDPVNPSAPKEQFPLIAKFPESVVKPVFTQPPWNQGRLYQQDIPKAQDDSDEEAETAKNPKKRWRARRKQLPKRQWILQEQVEFLQSMMAKRQHKQLDKDQISTRYEGIPEHNPSQYVLLEATPQGNISVTTLPTPHGTITFAQPASRKTMSMSEAEQAIENQRSHMTRYMMHDKRRMLNGGGPANHTKQRLFGKLSSKAKGDDEDDDIMGDLAFRNRKGSGKARKELLSSLGGGDLRVDPDGVIAGANDSEFGRGRKFGRFKNEEPDQAKSGGDDTGTAEATTKSADGMAMADDFYQRDVGKEYEELDYDANEQFDDDDVDVGETEVVVEGGGYADDDEDDDEEDNEMDGDQPSGAEGLASIAGFRLMLAKARGEITPEQAAEAAAAQGDKNKQEEDAAKKRSENAQKTQEEPVDHLTQIMAAAEKSAQAAKQKPVASPDEEKKKAAPVTTGLEVDENGQRMVTLQAVRREIWLHHGTIPMKRLMKIFDIKKKAHKDRQNKFREVVKELCTMETDPVGGRMLVLKQHYSNMG
jgi:hypothetical protein